MPEVDVFAGEVALPHAPGIGVAEYVSRNVELAERLMGRGQDEALDIGVRRRTDQVGELVGGVRTRRPERAEPHDGRVNCGIQVIGVEKDGFRYIGFAEKQPVFSGEGQDCGTLGRVGAHRQG